MKKLTIVILMICFSVLVSAETFINHPNWIETRTADLDRRFNNDEALVVMFYRTTCFNSELRKHVVSSWLSDHNINVYGVDVDDQNISRWVWEKIQAPSVSLPVIAIVKNRNEYDVFPASISMRLIQQRLHELLGIYDASVVDFYQINRRTFDAYGTQDTARYLTPRSQIEPVLVARSDAIVSGISGDMEKLRAIHSWVAENIFYDYEMLETGNRTVTAIGTYNLRRSICEGYSNLTAALCQAAGIPARVVHGFALGVGSDENVMDVWNIYNTYLQNNDLNTITTRMRGITGHAWNEAFVDGRWVILDTTWDSNNDFSKRPNGTYGMIRGEKTDKFFDPTLANISSSHMFWGTFGTAYTVSGPGSDRTNTGGDNTNANDNRTPTVIRSEFTTPGNHTFSYRENYPATIEIYVLGAGGGGQGGHSKAYQQGFSTRTEHGTGASGGGGAAAYMRINVTGSTSFNITVGAGGAGSARFSKGVGGSWESASSGSAGGDTTVRFGSTTLTVQGGRGGGGSAAQAISGGAGGRAGTAPGGQTGWASGNGGNGSDGRHNNDLRSSNAGGIAGRITGNGSENSFGGGGGALNASGAQAGGGGRGGYGNESGTNGGNGRVLIIVRY